ncbi:MAG TPA: imidazole glycerol phosphate synthase subunit HisH [Acidimicrobiales bacterium]|nr:imidazole glycerol phosphate synthase subunit HisH [Acidimicrobiales bacterium]
MRVAVVDYGAGNTRSVRAALASIGLASELTGDPDVIADADRVVLPGVGSARSAMARLRATGAADALARRHALGGPILGICLGLQLALAASEEDGGVEGLGLADGVARRVSLVRVPRLGWADVEPWGETYYFAHSFAADSPDAVATSEGLVAAVANGSFLGVQFHPEKSGSAGRVFLERCLTAA